MTKNTNDQEIHLTVGNKVYKLPNGFILAAQTDNISNNYYYGTDAYNSSLYNGDITQSSSEGSLINTNNDIIASLIIFPVLAILVSVALWRRVKSSQ